VYLQHSPGAVLHTSPKGVPQLSGLAKLKHNTTNGMRFSVFLMESHGLALRSASAL